MKAEFRLMTVNGQQIVEVWHDGERVAKIRAQADRGIRVISTFHIDSRIVPGFLGALRLNVLDVNLVSL